MTEPVVGVTLAAVVLSALLALAFSDLLKAILSLSTASAALAVYFFLKGAPFAAVFEAVVAAGLVPVLFLFMISLTETSRAERLADRKAGVIAVAGLVFAGALAYLGQYVYELPTGGSTNFTEPFSEALWTLRSIDVLAVSMLIFVGIVGVMRLTTVRLEEMETEPTDIESDSAADKAETPASGEPASDGGEKEEIA